MFICQLEKQNSQGLHAQEEELHCLDPKFIYLTLLKWKKKKKRHKPTCYNITFQTQVKKTKIQMVKNAQQWCSPWHSCNWSFCTLQIFVCWNEPLVELWFSHHELKLWFHIIYCLEMILKAVVVDTNKAIFIVLITFKKHGCLFWLCELRYFWTVVSDLLVNSWLAIDKAE